MPDRKQSRFANRSSKKGKAKNPVEGLNDHSVINDHLEYLEDPDEKDAMQELEDLSFEDLPVGSDTMLYNYMQKNSLVDEEYFVTLYKYDRDHGDMKTYCEKWVGQIPNEDQIGRVYGGGRFCLILQVTDHKGKTRGTTRKFKLHKRYDRFLNNVQSNENSAFPVISLGGTHGGNEGGNQLQDAVNLVRVMMSTFLPLMKMVTPPQQQIAAPGENTGSMAEMMKDNYKAMNEVMKESMLDNSQFFNDMKRRNVGLPELTEDENETTGVMGMINNILPVLEQVLPLITTRGAQGMQAVKTIQNMPQYKDVIKDKGTIKRLYQFIEKKHGTETALKVLKKFKLKHPDANPPGRPPNKKVVKPPK